MNVHDVSVALFVRGLTNLKSLLKKGEVSGIPAVDLIGAKLAEDMYDLGVQVQWAADGAKMAVSQLLGAKLAPTAFKAQSFGDLYGRIDEAIAYLNTVEAEALEASIGRTIELSHRGSSVTFTGTRYLLDFAIPNFFFHVTTAYGILRAKGVAVTKGDFTGLAFG